MKTIVKKIIPSILINHFYKKWLKFKYDVRFGPGVKVNLNNYFEGHNFIHTNSLVSNSFIGFGTYIASNSIIKSAKIGRFCAIGDNVRTSLGLHPTKDFVSIHPAFFSLQKYAGFTFVKSQFFTEHKYVDSKNKYVVKIGNDVWIGNNVIIMDGIEIGNGAVIAAGAIVTKNIEPYSIVGGVPAKLIKYRFNESIRSFLMKFNWWNKNLGWIENNIDFFCSIELFINEFQKK